MGIIWNVKNFFNTASNVVKNVIKNPSLLAPLMNNNNTEQEDEQELDMPIMPDVQSGSSSETWSSWANEFLNTPTFDINSMAQTGAADEPIEDPVQHFAAGTGDESNLDSEKIINSNKNKEESDEPSTFENVLDIYSIMNPSFLVQRWLTNWAMEAGEQIAKVPGWIEDNTYEAIVQENMNEEIAKNHKYVIKGGRPWYYGVEWTSGWAAFNEGIDRNAYRQMYQPFIDVLEWRDDVIWQIYSNIFEKIPEDASYEEYMDARGQFVKEIQDWDYFRIQRVTPRTNYEMNPLLGESSDKKDDVWFTPERFSKEEWEEIQNLAEDYKVWESYTPTEEELLTYIQVGQENNKAYREIAERYAAAMWKNLDEDEELMQARERFLDLARNWIHEKVQTKIWVIDWWEAAEAETNYEEIINDQLNRILVYVEWIFELEKEALAKPESERDYADWYIIDTANRARKALDKYATNLNDYMSRIINEWVNSKWEIIDALDQFADGSWLHEVLTDWLADIMWLEWAGWRMQHASPIDMFTKLANDWRYKYQQANTKRLSQWIWNFVEKKWSNVWDGFTEAGQFIAYGTLYRLTNLFKGDGKWMRPQSMRYFDNDFSVGKLIETDDSWTKRTVKKYALEFWEYAPEVAINVVPDIILMAYSGPGWAARTVSNIWRIGKFAEGTRRAAYVAKLRKRITALDKTLNWLEKIWAIWTKWANINSKNARIWNIIDRSLTQFALWQWMDAKLSIFDSESYSDTSFWISMWWSILWDILPEAKDLRWVWRTWARWWRWWIRTAWVWDLVDFISQSDKNADLVAAQLWKTNRFFTEQDLKTYVQSFADISKAAEDVYKGLSPRAKEAAGSWTKDLMYNYVKQAYWENSYIWKNVRELANNRATSPADIIKYVWNIPWTVKAWPYTSIIRLKHWTAAWVKTKEWEWYDIVLDNLDWGFDSRLRDWFSESDIRKISSMDWYKDTYKEKDRLFKKVWDKYYLTEDWLERFNLAPTSITLESLWITFEQAENTRKILKEKMKNLNGSKLQEGTIEDLADFGWYDEVVGKVKEILC